MPPLSGPEAPFGNHRSHIHHSGSFHAACVQRLYRVTKLTLHTRLLTRPKTLSDLTLQLLSFPTANLSANVSDPSSKKTHNPTISFVSATASLVPATTIHSCLNYCNSPYGLTASPHLPFSLFSTEEFPISPRIDSNIPSYPGCKNLFGPGPASLSELICKPVLPRPQILTPLQPTSLLAVLQTHLAPFSSGPYCCQWLECSSP